jgi:ubiquinone biosynthesis protein
MVGLRLAITAERLGAVFVKLAQAFSTRLDVIPEDTAVSLARLRENVKPLPFSVIQQIVTHSLGSTAEERIKTLEEAPLATGSIAQVHRAFFRDGRIVALKVMRPGILELISTDLALLKIMTRGLAKLPWFKGIPIIDAVQEVAATIQNQANFSLEAANLRSFRAYFLDDWRVEVPRVIDEITRSDVLAMDCIDTSDRVAPNDGEVS